MGSSRNHSVVGAWAEEHLGKGRRRPARSMARKARLQLEQLEDRSLLSVTLAHPTYVMVANSNSATPFAGIIDLLEMKAQRTGHTNRIRGLLASCGLAVTTVGTDFPAVLAKLRSWDGQPAPA